MKPIILIIIKLLLVTTLCAQQNTTISNLRSLHKADASTQSLTETTDSNRKYFGVYGMASLNSEGLSQLNTSGKFSCYFIPWQRNRFMNITHLSFNKNASNSDSLLVSTILFPELGNAAFLGTTEFITQLGDNNGTHRYYASLFYEFGYKNVKASRRIGEQDSLLRFDALSHTIGAKLICSYSAMVNNKLKEFKLSLAPYYHVANIPDEDNDEYRYLLQQPNGNMPSSLHSLGIKTAVSFDYLQVFADFRSTLNPYNRIQRDDVKGFSTNIGVVVYASVLEF